MSNCTIVTCYYRSPAKHSNSNYDEWMTNFLTTIDNNMLIFCDETSYNFIVDLRKNFAAKTQVLIVPLTETYCGKPEMQQIWQKEWERDHEKHIHNINLYIIWNEKSMFVQRAITLNPFNSEFFMWCDIGCFRNKADLVLFKNGWPAAQFLDRANREKMYVLNISPFKQHETQALPNGLTCSFEHVNRIGGTIFFGHKDIFSAWIGLYYHYLNEYFDKHYFAGKDQSIMSTLCVLHPELIELVTPVQGEGDPWFYLQRYFLK